MSKRRQVLAAAMAIALTWLSAPSAQRRGVNPDALVVAAFLERVNAYVAIHKQIEDAAPKLPDDATPKQVDQVQRALAAGIVAQRPAAKRGDLFTPELTAFVKELLARVFAGPAGRQLRGSIMDENVKALPLKVNQRYPDVYPMTTMPPEVLEALPALPEEMQYRFVGDALILLDHHAHIIPDFIPDAMPPRTP